MQLAERGGVGQPVLVDQLACAGNAIVASLECWFAVRPGRRCSPSCNTVESPFSRTCAPVFVAVGSMPPVCAHGSLYHTVVLFLRRPGHENERPENWCVAPSRANGGLGQLLVGHSYFCDPPHALGRPFAKPQEGATRVVLGMVQEREHYTGAVTGVAQLAAHGRHAGRLSDRAHVHHNLVVHLQTLAGRNRC